MFGGDLSMTRDSDSSAISGKHRIGVPERQLDHVRPGRDFDFLATGETATVVIGYTAIDDDGGPAHRCRHAHHHGHWHQ